MFIIILFSDAAVIAPATRAVNDAAARQIKKNSADIWTCATGLPGPIVEMNSAAKQGTYDVLVVGLDKIEIRQIRISVYIPWYVGECWQVWLSVRAPTAAVERRWQVVAIVRQLLLFYSIIYSRPQSPMIACPIKYIFWLFAIFFIKTVVADFFYAAVYAAFG